MILTRRRLYMLPTRHGLLFTLVLIVIFLASVNYNNGLAYGLTFLLAAMALVGMLHTHRNLSGLHVDILSASPAFAGQTAAFRVAVRNPDAVPRVSLWLICGDHRQLFHVAPHATVQLQVPVRTSGRGYLTCPPIRLTSAHPLGLQYTWSAPINGSVRGIVYPSPAGDLPLPRSLSRAGFAEPEPGADGDDFTGLREYAPGDPPRHVHWKAMASHQILLTKVFSAEAAEDLWLDWDRAGGSTESRLSQLTRWVVAAEGRSLYYGLRMPGRSIAPGRGPEHYHRCLSMLGLWGIEGAPAAGGVIREEAGGA